uniref:Uncharacterized protein n=1 Tax=Peronospora matthiolae TaxID=2874970 RepID=A0AAV1V3W7_9STRA
MNPMHVPRARRSGFSRLSLQSETTALVRRHKVVAAAAVAAPVGHKSSRVRTLRRSFVPSTSRETDVQSKACRLVIAARGASERHTRTVAVALSIGFPLAKEVVVEPLPLHETTNRSRKSDRLFGYYWAPIPTAAPSSSSQTPRVVRIVVS